MLSSRPRNGLETFKKVSYSRGQRGGRMERWEVDISNYTICLWAAHRLESNWIRDSPAGARVLSPTSSPQARGSGTGRRSPWALALKAVGLVRRSSTDWGRRRPGSWAAHRGFQGHWVPGRSRGSIGIWVGPDCSSWRTSWENQGWVWLVVGGHCGPRFREPSPACVLWRWPFWGNLAPPISAEKPRPRPNNDPVGESQPHPSVNKLPKDPRAHSCLQSHPKLEKYSTMLSSDIYFKSNFKFIWSLFQWMVLDMKFFFSNLWRVISPKIIW